LRENFMEFIDPGKGNMLPVIKETVRKIIGREDYMKLREERLDDVKRRIKHDLNTLMGGEVVGEVVFDEWNVMP
jgi:hypothetical protein